MAVKRIEILNGMSVLKEMQDAQNEEKFLLKSEIPDYSDVGELKALITDLTSKLESLESTVDEQAAEINRLRLELEQLSDSVSDEEITPADIAELFSA